MSNRLASATSPYLLQHRDNPVDWYEWGDEAFAEARRRDVPIFLSVGYSACHWCHVMAHESFEDEHTAAFMNDHFVNIKVDREERPDVDSIYMTAVQTMTRQGGWPMSVWLTPEGKPFHAGTYFPPTPRHGLPSFLQILGAISEAWQSKRSEVAGHADDLTQALDRVTPIATTAADEAALRTAYEDIAAGFDPVHGGFGGAPKFPQAPVLDFLLTVSDHPWAGKAMGMVETTLAKMASGGLWDHVGFGFARYSVDARWQIPHFEKMLYDNAQLARLYLRAWQRTGQSLHRRIATDTLEYVLRDLLLSDGGFASAEDADSEGEEGLFYVWSEDEFLAIATEDGPVVASLWGVTAGGNFEGANHLQEVRSPETAAHLHSVPVVEVRSAAERVRQRLFDRRGSRVRPGLDDKVVAAWNGLMLRVLADAAAALGEDRYLEVARRNAEFVLGHMRSPSGLLHRSWAKGSVGPLGVLEDQAGYGLGLLSLYQATGEPKWYRAASELIRRIPDHFMDGDELFATAVEVDDLIMRPQDQMDNPQPSGASLAVEAFQTLALLDNDAELFDLADRAARGSGRLIEAAPSAVGHLLATLTAFADPREVAVVGPEAGAFAIEYRKRDRPGTVIAMSLSPSDEVPLLVGRGTDESTLAYVCRGFVCDRPVDDPAAMGLLLAKA